MMFYKSLRSSWAHKQYIVEILRSLINKIWWSQNIITMMSKLVHDRQTQLKATAASCASRGHICTFPLCCRQFLWNWSPSHDIILLMYHNSSTSRGWYQCPNGRLLSKLLWIFRTMGRQRTASRWRDVSAYFRNLRRCGGWMKVFPW